MIKRFIAGLAAVLAASILWTSSAPAYVQYDQPTGTSCCFASMAMVVTNVTGLYRTPRDMLREFSAYYVGAAKHSLMHAVAYRYHLVASYFGPNDHRNGMKSSGSIKKGFRYAARSIPYGAQAVVLFRFGHFTSTGHCVVLYDYAHGHFQISDPNGKGKHGDSERRKGWSAKALLRRGNAYKLWIFW